METNILVAVGWIQLHGSDWGFEIRDPRGKVLWSRKIRYWEEDSVIRARVMEACIDFNVKADITGTRTVNWANKNEVEFD